MATSLQFHLEMPIQSEPIVPTAALTFARWLPLDPADALVLKRDNLEVALRFQIESVWWASQPAIEDLPRMVNVLAHRLWADVLADDLPGDLVSYACSRDYALPTDALPNDLEDQLCTLGKAVTSVAVRAYNRLIDFARCERGQYWLKPYLDDPHGTQTLLTKFRARVRAPGGAWHPFHPGIDMVRVDLVPQERYLTQDDWQRAKRWFATEGRAPLVGSLLAGAEELAGVGHRRSALTEAVTALEVALFQFARRPRLDRLGENYSPHRAGVESLKAHVEHLGLTASISYLLPVLLSNEVLPDAVLTHVRRAISIRQNVVHEGQRSVTEPVLRECLGAIRKLCATLAEMTDDDPK